MKYINQLEYAHLPYPTKIKLENIPDEKKKTTVRSSGCGLCCACMTVDLLTDKSLDIEECVRIAEGCLANHGVGTDMSILAPVIAEKFGLSYSKTNDLEMAIEHLRAGGVIIAHVGIPKDATIGLFTKSGHYISLISTDGKEFCILDPSWSEEKYKIPERLGRVNEDNYPYLYCDVNTVHSETKPGRTKYHLFSRKKEQK
jgi:hypothetical protein